MILFYDSMDLNKYYVFRNTRLVNIHLNYP